MEKYLNLVSKKDKKYKFFVQRIYKMNQKSYLQIVNDSFNSLESNSLEMLSNFTVAYFLF